MNERGRHHRAGRAGAGVAARVLALTAVGRVQRGAFLAPTLDALLQASGLPREDRALATDLAYGTTRRLIQLDATLSPHLADPGRLPPEVLDALRIGAFEIHFRGTPAYAAVDAWVSVVARRAPGLAGLVNAVLRRSRPLEEGLDPALDASLPPWLYERFVAALGGRAGEAAASMLEPEPLWLTAFGPEAEELLGADGASWAELDLGGSAAAPRSLRVRAPVSVGDLTAFRAGRVQPQNPASLAVALLLGAGPGDRVLDLASGRGVKSAVLAALGADVTAVELEPRRQAAADRNLARLGLAVRHVTADLTRPLTGLTAPYVLLDAPCSGTGTLRGNPEIKLRLTEEGTRAAADRQALMLATAAAATEAEGTLLYAVCALTPEEGPEAAGRFLERHPRFRAEPVALPLASVESGPGRFILPLHGLDGFYLARFRRSA